jgi:hypothetical protein
MFRQDAKEEVRILQKLIHKNVSYHPTCSQVTVPSYLVSPTRRLSSYLILYLIKASAERSPLLYLNTPIRTYIGYCEQNHCHSMMSKPTQRCCSQVSNTAMIKILYIAILNRLIYWLLGMGYWNWLILAWHASRTHHWAIKLHPGMLNPAYINSLNIIQR